MGVHIRTQYVYVQIYCTVYVYVHVYVYVYVYVCLCITPCACGVGWGVGGVPYGVGWGCEHETRDHTHAHTRTFLYTFFVYIHIIFAKSMVLSWFIFGLSIVWAMLTLVRHPGASTHSQDVDDQTYISIPSSTESRKLELKLSNPFRSLQCFMLFNVHFRRSAKWNMFWMIL